jgi:CheY-like chemotaxis protein
VAARSLRRGGYRVIEAPTAEEALRTMESEPRVDLLITDIVMPGMNGQELVESLRSQHPSLAILYISGYTPEEIGRRAFVESKRLLRKPFTPDQLIREAQQALRAARPRQAAG